MSSKMQHILRKTNLFRTWVLSYLIFLGTLFTLIFFINYFVDPLWCFNHSNKLNSRQLPHDECQQKSNYLVNHKNDYDALMVGSSRLTSFNQHDVSGFHTFNYSISGMLPSEIGNYIEFAKHHNSKQFNCIIIGLDFFSTNANFKGFGYREPALSFRNAESSLHKFQSLLTWDGLLLSGKNISLHFATSNTKPYYDRQNILTVPVLSKEVHDAYVMRDIVTFQRDLYGSSYQYMDLRNVFKKLVAQNPDTRFIVFATPESIILWQMMLKEGHLDEYLQWLTDIVTEFGSMYTFMGVNDLTTNSDNFIDAHHVYPHIGKQILSRILELPESKHSNAGVFLDRSNITNYCTAMKAIHNGRSTYKKETR